MRKLVAVTLVLVLGASMVGCGSKSSGTTAVGGADGKMKPPAGSGMPGAPDEGKGGNPGGMRKP